MQFSITLHTSHELKGNHAQGRILLGEETDFFESSLLFWSQQDYRRHWRDAVGRIAQGHGTSALITNMPNPQDANFLVWWPMWRRGDQVYVQNHLLFFGELPGPFDVTRHSDFVQERQTHSEEGEPLSEWVVPVDALTKFLSASA